LRPDSSKGSGYSGENPLGSWPKLDPAQPVGRKRNEAAVQLVSRFNEAGLLAIMPRHGEGFKRVYGEAEKARILQAFQRQPDLEADKTAT
jgi:hypothetical protein